MAFTPKAWSTYAKTLAARAAWQKPMTATSAKNIAANNIKAPSTNKGMTKQEVLDQAVSSWKAKVQWSNIMVNGTNIWSTKEFQWEDMANVQDIMTWKFSPQKATEQQEPMTEPKVEETDAVATTTADQQASWWQEKQNTETVQQQQVVWGMNVGASWTGWTQTKKQVLDQAISSWQASVDQSWNVITKSWQNIGNISWMDLSKSAIWQSAPNANQAVQQDQEALQQQKQDDLNKINAIKPDVALWLSNSPDSPFWNKFWQEAIDTESQVPGYMNERNKIIASSIMLNNPNMKFMSDAKRKETILHDIIDRQEWGIDPAIESWYNRTIDNVNNLINREIPAYKSEDYFNMLLKWEKIDYDAATGNPELKSARERFNNLQKFSTMDVTSLSEYMKSWELLKGGQTWNDLLNKGMWDSLNRAYSMYVTKSENSVYNYIGWEVSSFSPDKSLEWQKSQKFDLGTWLEWKISEKILSLMTDDKIPTLASFLAADDDVQRAKETARETEAQINDLSTEIENFADDVKTKVVEKGGEATDDPFLNAYIQEKTKPFVRRLTQLQSKYRNEIALLSDLSENARTEFEVKEYNKKAEIEWYQFVLWRLDKQKAEEAAAKQAAQQQSNRDKSFGLQVDQFNRQKSKADMPNMQITGYGADGKPIYQYYDSKTNTRKNAPTQSSTQATWIYVNAKFWNKNIDVDTAILPALQTAQSELEANGIKIAVGESKRDQTETIKGMASKYWIPFNAKNPNETAAALRKAWHQVADVWKSKHESWMAVDIYASWWWKVDDRTKAILNKNWFYQTAWAGDLGHFEYVGSLAGQWSNSMTNITQWIYNGTMNSTDILSPKTLKEYGLEWQSRDSIISTVNKSLFDTYLNKESTKDEIWELVTRAKATFPKDENSRVSPLKDTVWPNKTFQYLMENDLMEYDTSNSDAVEVMGSLLEKTFEWSKVDRDILYGSLKERFGRSVANDLLDYLNL